jgi:hypothetical protein
MDPLDARADLARIRSLMERARDYHHLPAPAAFVAGLAALGGASATAAIRAAGREARPARAIADIPIDLTLLWAGVFAVSLATLVALVLRSTRRAGVPLFSPLAVDVLHTLWPSLVAAAALTVSLIASERKDLIAPVWMLSYGAAAIAAGNYARAAVRGLGLAFLAAGVAQLAHPVAPEVAVGASFGLFHLAFGAVLALRPSTGS